MAEAIQVRKIKCPHCGWERKMEVKVDGNQYDVAAGGDRLRGVSDALQAAFEKIKERLNDRELDEANAWIEMPACPNPPCNKPYEYNVRSGETRK